MTSAVTDPALSPASVGLGGDGDEIAAIDEVEAEFRVTLDYADAPQWHTAGDVFRSLLVQLPPEQASDPETWRRFVRALTDVTGIDPQTITPDSPLIDQTQIWRGLSTLSAALWLLLVGMALVVVLGALLLAR
ncbi:hypothetical protein [Sphingomonas sp.]|uniref:hypothetical protein n=1 Tax=Sphingomonas sp. TaxID=28214 RepID=UPI002ED9968C